jgi:uncharacterized protein YndB with AHSA1/START domain
MTDQTTAGVRQSVTVPLTADKAFEVFVDRFEDWWPKEGTHSLTADPRAFVLEAREGGRWGEEDPDGNYRPWGSVLAVDRPSRILLGWQLTPAFDYDPDPAKRTEVEVTFEPEADGGTRVTLEHRGFEVWGEPGAEMRGSVEGGWGTLLERFAEHAAA